MSTTLERLEYGFDRDSRRTWRKRFLTTGEDNAYGYDGLSQVVNAARGNLNLNATAIGGVPAEAQAWDYDTTGNWRGYETKANGSVALDQLRVHDKGNRLTQIVGAPNPVLLDRAGRMREMSPDATGNWNQSQKITWDAWSRVVRVEQSGTITGSYAYDGLTRRTTRSTDGATWHSYYSDAWRPLEERRDSQTMPARQYYWGARHRDDLVRRDRAKTSGGPLDETRYVLMDYFSPAAITDETGTIKERYAFSAFGVRRILTPTFGDRATSECDFTFAFQGQFLDTESGFLNYGYRYYSSELGRWLCKDPIGENGGMNLYASFEDSPVNLVDYLGLKPNRRCKYVVEGGHKAGIDRQEQIFLENAENKPGCDRYFGASCGPRARNAGYVWPTQAIHAKALKDRDPRARPDDSTLAQELDRYIRRAQEEAEAECLKPDRCCKTVSLEVNIGNREDPAMKLALQDPWVDKADRYSNEYDCEEKTWKKGAKWTGA